MFTSFTSCGHFLEPDCFFGTSGKILVDIVRNWEEKKQKR